MLLSYDLHIHSCLSPCADDDMTPANIVGMAKLKGLDVIALTDHNSCLNCPAIMEAAKEYGLLVIPGMELTTMEEVHVVCLFPELDDALAFGEYVHEHLLPIPNREDLFGRQLIYGPEDEITGKEEILLLGSTDIPFDQVYELTHSYHGIMIPAHIEKNSNSLLHNLGFVPEDSHFPCAEIKNSDATDDIRTKYPYLNTCSIVYNSDAHSLWQIHEAVRHLDTQERTAAAILQTLAWNGGTIWA